MSAYRHTIVELITLLFVVLFLYTGISKLQDYAVLKEQIAMSPLLAPVASTIAGWLPWVEFLLVILLIVPRWRLKGLKASLVLMIAFTLYIIALLTLNEHVPCSCGGALEQLSWPQHIVFNSVFIALAAWGVHLERKIKQAYNSVWEGIGKQFENG